MIEPFPVILQSAFEPSRKLPKMVNKLSIQVLDAPFNFALVLRIGRMRKMRLSTMPFTPSLPFFFELWTKIRQYRLRMTFLLFQQRSDFLCFGLMIKLFSNHQEPAVIVDANHEPVLLALHRERTLEVDLPQIIRLFGPEKLPALMVPLVTIYAMLRENVVYGFSR